MSTNTQRSDQLLRDTLPHNTAEAGCRIEEPREVKAGIGVATVSGREVGSIEQPLFSPHDSGRVDPGVGKRSRTEQTPSDPRSRVLKAIPGLTGSVTPVSAEGAGRAIAWMGVGVLAWICALAIALGAARLIVDVSWTWNEDGGLLAFLGLLSVLLALFLSGLGWLAIVHGQKRRPSSRRRYCLRRS